MNTKIIKSLNNLCLPVPTEYATEIADKIDALPCCNVTEIRTRFKQKTSIIIVSDSDRDEAIKRIAELLLTYTK